MDAGPEILACSKLGIMWQGMTAAKAAKQSYGVPARAYNEKFPVERSRIVVWRSGIYSLYSRRNTFSLLS